MDYDLSKLEDYRETAISFLLQLGSKLDPEGSYDQNGLAGLTPSRQLTSDDVTYFVNLGDQLYWKWGPLVGLGSSRGVGKLSYLT